MSTPAAVEPVIRASAVYVRRQKLEVLPDDLRLRAVEWGVLFAVSGRHTVAQIGRHLALAPPDRDRALARLVSLGLVAERALSLPEYVQAAAASGDPVPRTLGELLRGAALQPAAASPLAAPDRPAEPTESLPGGQPVHPPGSDGEAARPVADSLARRDLELPFAPLQAPGRPTVPISSRAPRSSSTQQHADSESLAATPATLSLRRLIDFVMARANGDTDRGQLDVYRAFLRLDPALLRRNGITTLRFEDDRTVRDPELVAAILRAVEEGLGVVVPPSLVTALPMS